MYWISPINAYMCISPPKLNSATYNVTTCNWSNVVFIIMRVYLTPLKGEVWTSSSNTIICKRNVITTELENVAFPGGFLVDILGLNFRNSVRSTGILIFGQLPTANLTCLQSHKINKTLGNGLSYLFIYFCGKVKSFARFGNSHCRWFILSK